MAICDHVSEMDQARAHLADTRRLLAASEGGLRESADRITRGDEHVDASIDRVARGPIRRIRPGGKQ
jgi:hypothetical protein